MQNPTVPPFLIYSLEKMKLPRKTVLSFVKRYTVSSQQEGPILTLEQQIIMGF